MAEREPISRIDEAQDALLGMANLAESNVRKAVEALQSGQTETARSVYADAEAIEDRQARLETECLLAFSLLSPCGHRLRRLGAVLLIAADLTRTVADAAAIARLDPIPTQADEAAQPSRISQLAEDAIGMLRKSIDALVRAEVDLAVRVWEDQDAFQESVRACREEATRCIAEDDDRRRAVQAATVLQAAQVLERIGLRAAGIADRVRYTLTGRARAAASTGALTR